MAHESTLDNEAVDLRHVAELVVDEYQASPCAVVGGAHRLMGEGALGQPLGWRFGWGSAGRLWTEPPAGQEGRKAPLATPQTIFDLASLTKPVVALTLARLERQAVLRRDEPLGAFLPELADTPSGSVSLDLLSAHRAGLVAHRPFFVEKEGAKQPDKATILREAAQARRPDCEGEPPPNGFEPVYSDLGYILVGESLSRRTNRPLDELVADQIARPHGLTIASARQLTHQDPMAPRRIAPTERVDWRGGVLRGIVHDENAWVLGDRSMAGHAGLFGDVWSVVRLGCAVIDAWVARKTDWLTREQLEALVRARPGGTHAAGFDRRGGERPSSGARFGPQTVGHLGFTGTSIWIDLDRELVGVLLTNRVHPSRDHIAIRRARPAAYDALFEAMTEASP
jgi:CubicO group peptidase (beta-lactamase class C family)